MFTPTSEKMWNLLQSCVHRWSDLTHYPSSCRAISYTEWHIAQDLSNTPEPRPLRKLGISSLRCELSLPLFGTPSLHMCRYRYYSAHKTPQSHLKVVSCWNTLAASKLGSGLCRQPRPGPPSAHHIPLRWGMAANSLLLHKPVPVIKTLNGSPLKGSGLFLSWVVIFQGEFNLRYKWFQTGSSHVFGWNLNLAVLTFCVGLYTQTPFVLFLYVTEREEEDEIVLKEATVLISSEGSLLFFPPTHFFPEPVHFKSWPGPVCHVTCLPKDSFQINSSFSPRRLPPPCRETFRDTICSHGASRRQLTLINKDFIISLQLIVSFKKKSWFTVDQIVLKSKKEVSQTICFWELLVKR